jgi:hemerythrin-like domain-containing protein
MQNLKTATKNLENDHVYILHLIDVMEKIVLTSHSGVNNMETVVNLIRNYADAFHHAKEENLLFPLMATKGFSKEQGPIAVMLHDHVQGRSFVKAMSEEIENFKKGNNAALSKIHENMKGYIELLRGHIAKENNVLFRMADNVMSEKEQQDLLLEFAKIETNNFGGGVLESYISEIEKLEIFFVTTQQPKHNGKNATDSQIKN